MRINICCGCVKAVWVNAVLNALARITAWWMGKWPQTFYLWYTAKSLQLYGLRFLIYR